MIGFYYLHTNGALIFKKFRPEDDSPFVRKVWQFDSSNREYAYLIVLEAAAMGADPARIEHLINHWGLTDEDAQEFVKRTREFRLFMDGDQWCATYKDFVNLQESPAGFGKRAIDALISLPKPGLQQRKS